MGRLAALIAWQARTRDVQKYGVCQCGACLWCRARQAEASGDERLQSEVALELWQEFGSCGCGSCLPCKATRGIPRPRIFVEEPVPSARTGHSGRFAPSASPVFACGHEKTPENSRPMRGGLTSACRICEQDRYWRTRERRLAQFRARWRKTAQALRDAGLPAGNKWLGRLKDTPKASPP